MTATASTAAASTATVVKTRTATPKAVVVGRVLTVIAVLFLIFDAGMHTLAPEPVVQAFQQQGFPAATILPIGLLELGCIALYVVPRTSVLGAILLTAYLGGAFCTELRAEAPLFGGVLAPVYVAIVVWAAVYFRNAALRKALGVDILSR